MRILLCRAVLLAALFSALPAGAMTLFVSPDGESGFTLEGDNAGDAQLVEVSVEYDPALLSDPQVSTLSGTLTDLYDATPGTLLFSVDRGENLAAPFEAHLGFLKQGKDPGGIRSVTGTTRDPQGKSAAADASLNLSPRQEPAESPGAGGQEPGGSGSPARSEKGPAVNGPGPLHELAGPCVLQRFEDFKGEQGIGAFASLFDRAGGETVLQDPPIALSDGKTPVRVTLQAGPGAGELPALLVSDAKLVSVGRGEGGQWLITLLPNEGSGRTALILRGAEEAVEIPLVVAPPIPMPDGIDEKNFLPALRAYLDAKAKERGEWNTPEQTPFDEYAFSANFLAGRPKAPPGVSVGAAPH